jgi:hypothetical protein
LPLNDIAMLRYLLVATLITGQGLSSLAGATLCLHMDGGFCLERTADGQCQHRLPPATDPCCGNHLAVPADVSETSIGVAPCDCKHLAIADDPQLSVKSGEDYSQHLNAGPTVLSLIVPQTVTIALVRDTYAEIAGAGPSGALSFLAPVMLRC